MAMINIQEVPGCMADLKLQKRVFDTLSNYKMYMICCSPRGQALSVVIKQEFFEEALELIKNEFYRELNVATAVLDHSTNWKIVSAVGRNLVNSPHFISRLFSALARSR